MDTNEIRLKKLIDLINEHGQTFVANKVDIESSYISQLKNPKNPKKIGEKLARRIEQAFRKPHLWLDNNDDTIPTNAMPMPSRRLAPVISYVQAGNWGEVIDAYPVGEGFEQIEIDTRYSDNAYVLKVKGDSMMPTLSENSYIVVDPLEEWREGDIIVVRQNGDTEVTVKELIKDAGQWLLKPHNTRYEIMKLLPDAHVCGVVVENIRKFRR